MRTRMVRMITAAGLLTIGLTVTIGITPSAFARPFRGSIPWAVLLCKVKDRPQEPQTPKFFAEFLTEAGAGKGGLADYWRDISGRTIDLSGSVVKGWYTMSFTYAQQQAKGRWQVTEDCVNTAKSSKSDPFIPNDAYRIFVIVNTGSGNQGPGEAGGRVLLDAGGGWDRSFNAQEMGHTYDLAHSFSEYGTEYGDPWDVMSCYECFDDKNISHRFGRGGPGLNAHYLDRMGWLRRNRIFTFGRDGAMMSSVSLAALNHPEASGYLMVRVPFDPQDPFHYYTIELRKKDRWDTGIPSDTVLIHEVKSDGLSYLLRTPEQTNWAPVQTLKKNGVQIRVEKIESASATAKIIIEGLCLQDYVWRKADQTDYVCVTSETQAQTKYDNTQAAVRRNPKGGPWGPDTCLDGYVWREAFPGDHVCVTWPTRQEVVEDNRLADSRRHPFHQEAYGPNTCKEGYVWREADQTDYVCVTGETRDQTRYDNSQVAARRNPNGAWGPDTCLDGYVWRETFPGDHVCVTWPTRQEVVEDNRQAESRLMKP